MAEVDHPDAYQRLPVLSDNEPTATVGLRNPVDGVPCGFIPEAQLFAATVAVRQYICFSRDVASSARRVPISAIISGWLRG